MFFNIYYVVLFIITFDLKIFIFILMKKCNSNLRSATATSLIVRSLTWSDCPLALDQFRYLIPAVSLQSFDLVGWRSVTTSIVYRLWFDDVFLGSVSPLATEWFLWSEFFKLKLSSLARGIIVVQRTK